VSAGGLAQAPIFQPGAPGAPARELSADEAIQIADTSYSPADSPTRSAFMRSISAFWSLVTSVVNSKSTGS